MSLYDTADGALAPSYEGHHEVVEDTTLRGRVFMRTALLFVLGFVGVRYIGAAVDFWDFDVMFVFFFLLIWIVWATISRGMRTAIVGGASSSSNGTSAPVLHDSAWKRFTLDFISLVGYAIGLVTFAYIGSAIYEILISELISGPEAALLLFFFTTPVIALYWLEIKFDEELRACQHVLDKDGAST